MAPLRQVGPVHGATNVLSLAGAFGETNPLEVTNTPRTAGYAPAMAEPIHGKPLAVANGWIDRPAQTVGMSVLYVDQIQALPSQGIQTRLKDTIGFSAYAPFMHYRTAHWIYSKWDPIFRFANTALDMRFQVGHPAPLGNAPDAQRNLPGGVRMGPYFAPFRQAWRVPRFSTEPSTVIPRAQTGLAGG